MTRCRSVMSRSSTWMSGFPNRSNAVSQVASRRMSRLRGGRSLLIQVFRRTRMGRNLGVADVPGYSGRVDERERRMTRNEALFREVNERVHEKAEGFGGGGAFEYLCECANGDCTFQITLTLEQYEGVRADPAQFAVLPLHFTPEIEALVT